VECILKRFKDRIHVLPTGFQQEWFPLVFLPVFYSICHTTTKSQATADFWFTYRQPRLIVEGVAHRRRGHAILGCERQRCKKTFVRLPPRRGCTEWSPQIDASHFTL
jgi:hypothetical protein